MNIKGDKVMKKGLILLISLLLLVSLTLVACSNPPSTPTAASPVSTAPPASSGAPATTTAPAPVSSAPATSAAPANAQQYGGTLRIISYSPPTALGDPAEIASGSGNNMAVVPCLESLLNFDNSGTPRGLLATEWSIAPDGKSVTLKLRKGVKFQDGSDFNAQVAKWNMDRFLASKMASTVPMWAGIDVVDEFTIKLNLKYFTNSVLNTLDQSAAMMISKVAFDKNGGADWVKMNPVGTGPYLFKSFVRDTSLEFTRFDGYWGGKPYLDSVKFSYIVDPTTASIAFEAGQADVIQVASGGSVASDLIAKGYNYEKRNGPMMNLVPDSKNASSPLANLKVRQAIAYAIDRNKISQTLGHGLWDAVNQPATNQIFAHIDSNAYAFDPAKAKQLLADAGYGKGLTLTINSSSTFGTDALQSIQSYLADVGITVKLNVMSFASWNDMVYKGWENSLLYATQGATFTNWSSFLDLYYGGKSTRYSVLQKPTGLTDLIDKSLAAADFNAQKDYAQQAVKMLVDDCTAIPLYIQSETYILNKKVHDTHFDYLGGNGFRWSISTAWISK
jgi:peptide/nickel transport system substrate-binding protein